MRFTHHARRANWTLDRTRKYEQPTKGYKPNGLWLSVDGDWERWCREDGGHMFLGEHTFEFTVDEGCVLWLKSGEDIDRFTDEYSASGDDYGVDWDRLQWDHGGIVIAPYQWSRRLSVGWYYGWDVASACIWDLSTVHEVSQDSGRLTAESRTY